MTLGQMSHRQSTYGEHRESMAHGLEHRESMAHGAGAQGVHGGWHESQAVDRSGDMGHRPSTMGDMSHRSSVARGGHPRGRGAFRGRMPRITTPTRPLPCIHGRPASTCSLGACTRPLQPMCWILATLHASRQRWVDGYSWLSDGQQSMGTPSLAKLSLGMDQ